MTQPASSESSPPPYVPVVPTIAAPTSPRQVTINAVNWANVLDFTHLFRGFRLAINPAKLMIALLAIMLIYAAGRLFDAVWGPQVYPDELQAFISERPEVYRALRTSRIQQRADLLDQLMGQTAINEESFTIIAVARQQLKNDPAGAFRALKKYYRAQFDHDLANIHQNRLSAETGGSSSRFYSRTKTPAEIEQDARAIAAARLLANVQHARSVVGQGIFDTFLQFETDQFDRLIENTLTFIRIGPIRSTSLNDTFQGSAVSGGLLSRDPDRFWRSDTVVGCLANMTITAPLWLITGTAPIQWRPDRGDSDKLTWAAWFHMAAYRALYLIALAALALFSLLVLAFAGASIARLSALELAGIERPPLKEVFQFAFQRLWTFVKAPIAPFLILLAFGLLLTIGGLLGAIPFVGPLILGAIFFLFLGVAFVLMLLLLGILGGFNLLYPTVAVEGADAFDAMSRSFAYVYARPWRVLFYTITSLIYGAITFLFISFAVYLILLLTHTFAGWGVGFFGLHNGKYSGLSQLDTLWPAPQFLRLIQPINWYAMSGSEYLGALLLHFWVFLLITAIGAYVISYYFSIHTIMYLLLRRSVDGQNLREVFLESAKAVDTPSAPAPSSLPAT